MPDLKLYEALCSLPAVERIAQVGEVIFSQGDFPETIVLLEQGILKTEPNIASLTDSLRIYGLSECYFNKPINYTLRCESESKLQIIPASKCIELIRNEKELKVTFMSWVAQLLNHYNHGLA